MTIGTSYIYIITPVNIGYLPSGWEIFGPPLAWLRRVALVVKCKVGQNCKVKKKSLDVVNLVQDILAL